MAQPLGNRLVYLIPVGLLLVLAAFAHWHGVIPYPDPRFAAGDHIFYIAMARHPFDTTDPMTQTPPFAWRILTPLLVHVLPLPVLAGFWLVTVAGLAGAALGLEWFLSGLGLPRASVVAGGCAFVTLGPATGFTLFDYPLVDPLTFALLVVALGAVVHRQGMLLVAAVALGTLNKETALLGAVFALVWTVERRDRALFGWAAGSLVAWLVVYVGLRAFIQPLAGGSHLILKPPLIEAQRLLDATLGTWTVLLLVAIMQVFHPPRVWRSLAYLALIGVATAQVFASYDVARTVVSGFAVMIAACCFEVEYLAKGWQVSRWVLWSPILLIELIFWVPFASGHLSLILT